MDETNSTKRCSMCRQTKAREEFAKWGYSKDGRRGQCKDCLNPTGAKERAQRREREFLAKQGLRRCSGCAEVNRLSEFDVNKANPQGRGYVCKACKSARAKRRTLQRKGTIPVASKLCPRCEKEKANSEFYLDWSKVDCLSYSCKACEVAASVRYQREKPEEKKARQRRYYLAHREEILARIDGKESLERALRWQRENPERRAATRQRYNARKQQAHGNFTGEQWLALLEFYGAKCLRCNRTPPTVDHVIPLSKGGSNDIGNIQPLCRPCNSGKRARDTDYRTLAERTEFIAALKERGMF